MSDGFRRAESHEVEAVFSIIKRRIQWMDEKGIQQWNRCDYLNLFPMDYYVEQQRLGNLYVFSETTVKGAVVLLEEDERWSDISDTSAIYVHNFVGDVNAPGTGKRILAIVEDIAAKKGKHYVRLDCMHDNALLNRFYESLGYEPCGQCQVGSYIGNRKQKRITA